MNPTADQPPSEAARPGRGENSPTRSRWRLTFFEGILPFDKSRLAADIMAGFALAAMNIPQAMGYTKISGTPVITGLYTLLLPLVAFAMFGASRYLVVAADSATAAILAVGVSEWPPRPVHGMWRWPPWWRCWRRASCYWRACSGSGSWRTSFLAPF